MYHRRMSYEGRTPIRDVIRSVVLGAAMVSPAALEACTKDQPQPKPPEPDPLPSTTATGTAATATATATQPDEPVVSGASQRPRGKSDGGPMIPTRGFSGRGR
jgi:hypothetical protein